MDKLARLSFRCWNDNMEGITKLAEKENMTFTQAINKLIQESLRAKEKEDDKV